MQLPVFDVDALDRGEGIAALNRACEGAGFFYITNHGIDDALLLTVREQMLQFFALPLAERLAIGLDKSTCHHGYERMGEQRLEAGAPPDLKEGFYIGNELAADHPHVLAGYFNQGPNQWPVSLPSFRPAMEAYFTAMIGLAARMMRAMALSLGLQQDTFDSFCTDAMAVLRLLHYPPQPPNPQPGEKGCGEHTDWGCLTLLWQDDAGGLQVRSGGDWIDAPPLPGTFVVNMGDMFARWTNDRYRSTLHRVVNRSGRDRYSVPFFFEGNPGHRVAILEGCVVPGEAARYPATTVSDHLATMYRKTFA
jgi:isopenicillin N synthase-like dioxygenase